MLSEAKQILWRIFFRLGGIHGSILITYLFLVIFSERFLSWEGSSLQLILFLIAVLIILIFICPAALKKVGTLTIKLQEKEMSRKKSIGWILGFFVFSFGVLFCWYLSYYPGIFSSDAIYQYEQALSEKCNDWKPILQTTGLVPNYPILIVCGFTAIAAIQSFFRIDSANSYTEKQAGF